MKTRVILADDHAILRMGIRSLLDSTGRVEVVGEAGDGIEAIRLVETTPADVLVVDVAMPRLNGIEAVSQVKRLKPKLHVIVLTVHAEQEYIVEALRSGASGYLLKLSAFSDLLAAIDAAMAGQRYLGAGLHERALDELVGRLAAREPASNVARLSARERVVLQLIAEGHTAEDIGRRLNLSPHTIHTHRKHIMEKLGLHRSVELTRFAIRHQLTSLD